MPALDPETRAFLERLARSGIAPYHRLPVPEARALHARLRADAPRPPVPRVEDRSFPGPGGEVPVRVYFPEGEGPFGAVLYFHGGGWVLGSLETMDPVCRHLTLLTGCLVLSVNYRHAPEHKFPSAAEDAHSALRWAAEGAGGLPLDPNRLAVAGDSAGGNLATVACLMARDRGTPLPRFQALIYPVTDYNLNTPSYLENAEGFFLTREAMAWYWGHYLARLEDGAHPYASPLRAPDLRGLPPALVVTAELDPLRDEGEAYALRLWEAGVPAVSLRVRGTVHGFFAFPHLLQVARQVLHTVAGALRSALAP